LKTSVEKAYRSAYFPLLAWAVHLAIIGACLAMIDFHDKLEIQQLLKKALPWTLSVNAMAILFGIYLCRSDFARTVKTLLNKTGGLLLLLALAAWLISTMAVPRTHRIFFDEDIYVNVGQTMALDFQAGVCDFGTFENGHYRPHWITYIKQPAGWPYLVALAFRLSGVAENHAFALNRLIFTATVVLAFFITLRLTASNTLALIAALGYVCIPHNTIWSNTTAAEPAAALFNALAIYLLLIYLRSGKNRHLYLSACLLPFACQMRPESILILPLIIMIVLLVAPGMLRQRKTWAFGVITTAMLAPHILHLYAVGGRHWGAEAATFSAAYFFGNLAVNGLYFLDDRLFPIVITVFAAIGLALSRSPLKNRLLLLSWFLCFFVVFLFFYAGSYRYGADSRFALMTFMPLCVLAAMGVGGTRDAVDRFLHDQPKRSPGTARAVFAVAVGLFVLSGAHHAPLVSAIGEEGWAARRDHRFVEEVLPTLPESSIIFTHNPSMFLVLGRSAIQLYAAIDDPDLMERLLETHPGLLYFHHDFWCNTDSVASLRLCRMIEENYDLHQVAATQHRGQFFAMYQMLPASGQVRIDAAPAASDRR
jgi:hypothetical protein